MNILIGFFVIVGAIFLFLLYKPKTYRSIEIFVLTCDMGLMSGIVSGGWAIFQIIEMITQLTILITCFLQFRQEFKERTPKNQKIEILSSRMKFRKKFVKRVV